MVFLWRKNVLLSSLKLDFIMWLRGPQVIGTFEKLAPTPVRSLRGMLRSCLRTFRYVPSPHDAREEI